MYTNIICINLFSPLKTSMEGTKIVFLEKVTPIKRAIFGIYVKFPGCKLM